VRRHDAGAGAAARAYMWGRSKSKIVKLTAPGARQPVQSAELYAVLALHCGQGPMIRRRTSRQPDGCATAPSSRRAARLRPAPFRGGGAHRWALVGRIHAAGEPAGAGTGRRQRAVRDLAREIRKCFLRDRRIDAIPVVTPMFQDTVFKSQQLDWSTA
jgi:hypothetical protein